MELLLKTILSQKWFLGVRAEESLFFYSAKYLNRSKLTRKYYKNNFIETMLFPLKNDYPVRVFNLNQAKKFHQESLNKIKHNPKILIKFIEQDYTNWQKIDKTCQILKKQIAVKNFKLSQALFLQLLNLYSRYGNLFFIIFSQGMVMTKNQKEIPQNVGKILQKHNQWRNSVTFKEEKMGRIIYDYLNFLVKNKKLAINPKDIMKYLTASEVIKIITKKMSDQKLKDIIATRKNNGYIFTFLHNPKNQGVIDNPGLIAKIKKHFQQQLILENQTAKAIKGLTAYGVKQKITGQVLIIKDKKELATNKINLKNKILVAIQTTPHFIPYLKKIKAIITDEGGITCHAAIIARELKIPCVVGAKNATQIFINGDRVEIDTLNGEINKLLN